MGTHGLSGLLEDRWDGRGIFQAARFVAVSSLSR